MRGFQESKKTPSWSKSRKTPSICRSAQWSPNELSKLSLPHFLACMCGMNPDDPFLGNVVNWPDLAFLQVLLCYWIWTCEREFATVLVGRQVREYTVIAEKQFFVYSLHFWSIKCHSIRIQTVEIKTNFCPRTFWQTLAQVRLEEGLSGWYSGMRVHLLRQVPNLAITMCFYEGFIYAYRHEFLLWINLYLTSIPVV